MMENPQWLIAAFGVFAVLVIFSAGVAFQKLAELDRRLTMELANSRVEIHEAREQHVNNKVAMAKLEVLLHQIKDKTL